MRIILLSVTIALFLILAGFFSVYYDHGQHGMYAGYAGVEKQHVDKINHFLNSNENVMTLGFLEDSEQSHMVDVRHVLNGFKIAFGIVFVLLLLQLVPIFLGTTARAAKLQKPNPQKLRLHKLSLQKRNDEDRYYVIRKSLSSGSIGALAFVALLALSSLFDFGAFWMMFHEILFPQGNWQFPAGSALITLFPQQFFENFALHVLLATASYGALLLVCLTIGRRKRREPICEINGK